MMKVVVLLVAVLVHVNCQRHELEKEISRSTGWVKGVLPDNPEEKLMVNMAYSLRNIIDYDSRTQLLHTSGYLSVRWKDERFRWDISMFGNISSVSVPCQQLQKPDIKVYNGGMVMDPDSNCAVYHDGSISYAPPVDMKTFCVASEPDGDTFSCNITLGTWTHNCEQMNFTSRESFIDVIDYSGGWRWELMSTSSKLNVMYYPCCPESYCNVKITLDFKDKSKTGWF